MKKDLRRARQGTADGKKGSKKILLDIKELGCTLLKAHGQTPRPGDRLTRSALDDDQKRDKDADITPAKTVLEETSGQIIGKNASFAEYRAGPKKIIFPDLKIEVTAWGGGVPPTRVGAGGREERANVGCPNE